MIVVNATSGRLSHDFIGAEESFDGLAARARPLEELRLDDVAHENPLNSSLRVFDESLDKKPLALDIQA
jgi:hypothetical protein